VYARVHEHLSREGEVNAMFAIFRTPLAKDNNRFMSKKLHANAGGNLFALARQNRKHLTAAESILWRFKIEKIHGVKFRRQHPIGQYVADFYCAAYRIVIEVDGVYHESQQAYDEERDLKLKNLNIIVLRSTNDQVQSSRRLIPGSSPEGKGGRAYNGHCAQVPLLQERDLG
jgi:very-short-patch-repair endonuclease